MRPIFQAPRTVNHVRVNRDAEDGPGSRRSVLMTEDALLPVSPLAGLLPCALSLLDEVGAVQQSLALTTRLAINVSIHPQQLVGQGGILILHFGMRELQSESRLRGLLQSSLLTFCQDFQFRDDTAQVRISQR